MKKIIFIFVLISCFAVGFAETGYNKRLWLSRKGSLNLQFQIEEGKDKRWNDTEVEQKPILGKETFVFYHYVNNMFFAVSYSIPAEKTKQVIKKFTDLILEMPTYTLEKEIYVNNMFEAGEYENKEEIELKLNKTLAMASLDVEYNGHDLLEQLQNKEGSGKISIYDYNDDTRVYLFENFIKNQTFVIYVYHEQDY